MKEKDMEKLLMIYLNLSLVIPEEGVHLDEDTTANLIEGNLSKRELKPIVKHLVNCAFCRHLTAEIIKFDSMLAEQESIQVSQPTKISETIRELLSEFFQPMPASLEAFEEKTEDKREETKEGFSDEREKKEER